MKEETIKVNTKLIKYVMEDAGYSISTLALKLRVSPYQLEALLKGGMTINQLKRLSKAVNRTLATLLLPCDEEVDWLRIYDELTDDYDSGSISNIELYAYKELIEKPMKDEWDYGGSQ